MRMYCGGRGSALQSVGIPENTKDIPENSPVPHRNPSAVHIRRKKLETWEDFISKAIRSGLPPLRVVMWSISVGILSGAIIGSFRLVTGIMVQYVKEFYLYVREGHWWWIAAAAAASFLISLFIAWIIKSSPLVAYSGTADVEARLRAQNPSWWNWWRLLWRKFVGATISLSTGLYLGCEGPAIQMGATIGLGFSGATENNRQHKRELVAAGLAAGLSAAFTAPIAATLFLIEGDYLNKDGFHYPLKTILAAFLASISSGYVTFLILGPDPDFMLVRPSPLQAFSYWQLIPVGIGCGVLGFLYEKILSWGINVYDKLHIPHAIRMFIPLMLSIPIGLFLPNTLGDGSFLAGVLSKGAAAIPIWMLFVYLILRLVFAQVSYGSGAPSGIFLPICSLGVIYGIFCGKILAALHLGPHSLSYYSLLGVACLGGLFGAVIKKPLTAVVLAVEVTSFNDLKTIAVVAIIAYFTTNAFDKIDKKISKSKPISKSNPKAKADQSGGNNSPTIKDIIDKGIDFIEVFDKSPRAVPNFNQSGMEEDYYGLQL